MDFGIRSDEMMEAFFKKAFQKYVNNEDVQFITDFYLQPHLDSGKLVVLNDDDEVLSSIVIDGWKCCNKDIFYEKVEHRLNEVLKSLQQSGFLESLNLLRPYSFVLVDDEKETISELLLVDDQGTMLIHDGLLNNLEEELETFLKKLLES